MYELIIQLIPEKYLIYIPVITVACKLACDVICATTNTPDPNTTWGKLYKVIEFIAMNNEKAKQIWGKK